MKKTKVLKWIILAIAIAINVFILVNAFINGKASAEESNHIAHTTAGVINTIKPETITDKNFPQFAYNIRKLFGHFGLFVLSGFFSSWSLYLFVKGSKIRYFAYELLITLGFGFVVALVSEIVQIYTPGRTGAWSDVGIDSGGYFIGVLLLFLILLILKSPIFLTKKQLENRAK